MYLYKQQRKERYPGEYVFVGVDTSLNVNFKEYQLEELRMLANEKGLGVTTLARMWLMERLKDEKQKPA